METSDFETDDHTHCLRRNLLEHRSYRSMLHVAVITMLDDLAPLFLIVTCVLIIQVGTIGLIVYGYVALTPMLGATAIIIPFIIIFVLAFSFAFISKRKPQRGYWGHLTIEEKVTRFVEEVRARELQKQQRRFQ